jgi:8-oxo-dGTP pyrophosphatase MutT (NUDIX family)
MAFPGGRSAPGDADLLATAIRETREEVGLDLTERGVLLGALPPIPAIGRGRATGMLVAPFVFELAEEPNLTPNDEVVEVVWGPLAAMIDGSIDTTIDYEHEGGSLTLPGYLVGERIVWGLTHRMLGMLLDEIRAL